MEPKTAHRMRMAMRPRGSRVGGLTAASMAPAAAGLPTVPQTINQAQMQSLTTVRARMRHLALNDPYMRRYIELLKMNIVGPRGMTCHPRPLNTDGTVDKEDQAFLQREFNRWAGARTCDVAHKMNWVGIQNCVVAHLGKDGEAFIRRIRGSAAGNEYRFGLQLFDPESIDFNYNDRRGDNIVIFGVEMTPFMRPVAYWVKEASPNPWINTTHAAVKRQRIPAEDVYHVFVQEDATQIRGFPTAAAALLSVHQASGFMEAELIASRASASKMGFYKRKMDDNAVDPNTPDLPPGAEDEDGEFLEDFEPGHMSVLPPGWEMDFMDPKHPNSGAGEFVKTALRMAAAGLGPAYESLAQDREGVNYSSIRDGRVEERDLYIAQQEFHATGWMTWVWENWLEAFLLSPRSGTMPQAKKDKFLPVRFSGRRWQWVDPQKQATAEKLQIELGLKSRGEVIEESGRDPDEVWDRIDAEADDDRIPQMAGTTQAAEQTDDEAEGKNDEQDEESA